MPSDNSEKSQKQVNMGDLDPIYSFQIIFTGKQMNDITISLTLLFKNLFVSPIFSIKNSLSLRKCCVYIIYYIIFSFLIVYLICILLGHEIGVRFLA